ncbi:MAG: hypothetical protein AUG04_03620 [Deltaproteobacteria bacterium 13_1_20CM_2_69_21]|nr:MAG: hypothetical protein AUG04_03620 [Deltaproteobacteria bacterium 13_1_20CM_2_69_21]
MFFVHGGVPGDSRPFLVQPDQILRLTPQVSEESSWSPDSRWIVFDSNRRSDRNKAGRAARLRNATGVLERSCEIVRVRAP